MLFPPPPHRHIERPAALVCWFSWGELRRIGREVAAATRRARIAIPRITGRPVELPVPLACVLERRPYSVADWRPNMPRGSEGFRGRRVPVIHAASAPG